MLYFGISNMWCCRECGKKNCLSQTTIYIECTLTRTTLWKDKFANIKMKNMHARVSEIQPLEIYLIIS